MFSPARADSVGQGRVFAFATLHPVRTHTGFHRHGLLSVTLAGTIQHCDLSIALDFEHESL